jgi:hypothetical protein
LVRGRATEVLAGSPQIVLTWIATFLATPSLLASAPPLDLALLPLQSRWLLALTLGVDRRAVVLQVWMVHTRRKKLSELSL